MTKLGAKLLTATIKNPTKREIIYRMLMDYTTAYRAMEQNDLAEKMLKYVHNYLDKPNLVIINLLGGLGNQMYLYTFGKALESKGYSVIFDGGHYKNISQDSHTGGGGNPKNKSKIPTNIRNLEITNFNLTLPIDLDFDKELFFDLVDKDRANLPQNERLNHPYKYLINSAYDINSQEIISPRSYFSGYYFLSPIFAKHLDSAIRADFSLKTPLSPTNANLKAHILSTNDSVFLHIRRGDFLNTDFVNLCEGKYYEGAIRLIKSKLTKPHIFIFSNDMAWCERNFLNMLSDSCKEGVKFEFVANNGEDSAVQEMELMRSCQNAITANSSFSWWASYLIDNPHKIVVRPNRETKDSAPVTYGDSLAYNDIVLVDSHTGGIKIRD